MSSEFTCSVPGCKRPHEARGWCNAHYLRWRTHGDVRANVPIRERRPPGLSGSELIAVFWSRLNERPSGCWEWSRAKTADGYGTTDMGRETILTHRLAWELTHGPIPEGALVCHRCDNPPCCNPEHLFLGTYGDNARDTVAKGRHVVRSKLTPAQVREIRTRLADGDTQTAIADTYGVSPRTIGMIATGYRWRSV